MKKIALLQAIVCIGLAVTLVGCAQYVMIESGIQSHFDYPNSNVQPLGPVKVKTPGGGGGFLTPPVRTSEDDLKLYNDAIAQVSGANFVIDYIKTYTVYGFAGLFFWSEMELEGTAVKMEVGKQQLNR